MKYIKNLPAFMFITIIIGCAGQVTPIPDMESRDAKLYSEKCGPCHSVPHPKRHSPEQWEHIVVTMDKEAVHKGISPLTKDEREAILGYLSKHSR